MTVQHHVNQEEADFELMADILEAEMREAIDLALSEDDPLSLTGNTRLKMHQACKKVVAQAIARGVI